MRVKEVSQICLIICKYAVMLPFVRCDGFATILTKRFVRVYGFQVEGFVVVK